MDKKRSEVYERVIILIFDLWLLIIFAFFICIWLHCYQITFTYLLVFTKLYGLIAKASNCQHMELLKMQVQNLREAVEPLLQREA